MSRSNRALVGPRGQGLPSCASDPPWEVAAPTRPAGQPALSAPPCQQKRCPALSEGGAGGAALRSAPPAP
eukprot:8007519-Alexandrium_andersonii.AAC.1